MRVIRSQEYESSRWDQDLTVLGILLVQEARRVFSDARRWLIYLSGVWARPPTRPRVRRSGWQSRVVRSPFEMRHGGGLVSGHLIRIRLRNCILHQQGVQNPKQPTHEAEQSSQRNDYVGNAIEKINAKDRYDWHNQYGAQHKHRTLTNSFGAGRRLLIVGLKIASRNRSPGRQHGHDAVKQETTP